MTRYVFTFLSTSLIMSLLIFGFAALGELFPKIFTARLRYAAWLIILIGLIIPIRPMIGSGLINIGLPAETLVRQSVSYDAATNEPQNFLAASQGTFAPEHTTETTPGALPPALQGVLPELTPMMIIALIWLGGAIGVFAFHIWRYARFIAVVKRWSEAVEDEVVLSVFKNVKNEKGLANKDIRLRKCNFVSTSMLIGFFRPMVLLPQKHFETDELEMIFRHELVHYKRRDLLAKPAMMLAASVYWFNPAIYLMNAAMQADCEASCDEAVLKEVGRQNNRFYAELVIEMIGGKKKAGTILSTCFYGGKRSVKKRMDAIMDPTGRVRTLSFAALCTVVALTVMSGSVFAFSQSQAGRQPTLPHILSYGEEPLTEEYREDEQITAMQARDTDYAEPQGEQVDAVLDNNDGPATQAALEQAPAENQTPVDDINIQDVTENAQDVPINVQDTPVNIQDVPINVQDTPVNVRQQEPPGIEQQRENPVYVPQNTTAQNQNHGHNQGHDRQNQEPGNHGNNRHSPNRSPENLCGNRPANPAVSLERAIEIGYEELARRGYTGAFRRDSGMDWERNQWVWELEFRVQGGRLPLVEMYISTDTGAVVKFEWDD